MKENLPPIRQNTYIAASVDRVWDTISSAKGWDAWFTKGLKLDLREGGDIHFRWENFGGTGIVEDGGKILKVVPNETFVFQWSPAGHPTTVTMNVTKHGPGTDLEILEEGYLFNEIAPYVSCATGWGEAATLLKFYLEHGVVYGAVP